jgi:hypothetical protein
MECIKKFLSYLCFFVGTLRTDEDGAIIFETDRKKFERVEWH